MNTENLHQKYVKLKDASSNKAMIKHKNFQKLKT